MVEVVVYFSALAAEKRALWPWRAAAVEEDDRVVMVPARWATRKAKPLVFWMVRRNMVTATLRMLAGIV